MSIKLSGKWIVVTGGSSGIGQATASALAAEGVRVVSLGRTFQDGSPSGVTEVVADLSTARGVEAAVSNIVEVIGNEPLAGVVHAAAASHLGPALGLAPAQIDEVFDLNVKAPMTLTPAVIGRFDGNGIIVLVGSRAAVGPAVCNSAYAASKAAIRSLAATWRLEFEPIGVSVCEVIPGSTRTALRVRALAALEVAIQRANEVAKSDAYDAWAGRFLTPPEPDTTPEEVASSIVDLFATESPRSRTYVPGSERLKEVARLVPSSVAASVSSRLRRR